MRDEMLGSFETGSHLLMNLRGSQDTLTVWRWTSYCEK